MADQEKFEYLVSLASRWAKDQEELILRRGIPLAPRYLADANRVGVQKASRVKVLIVDRIPMPANAETGRSSTEPPHH